MRRLRIVETRLIFLSIIMRKILMKSYWSNKKIIGNREQNNFGCREVIKIPVVFILLLPHDGKRIQFYNRKLSSEFGLIGRLNWVILLWIITPICSRHNMVHLMSSLTLLRREFLKKLTRTWSVLLQLKRSNWLCLACTHIKLPDRMD